MSKSAPNIAKQTDSQTRLDSGWSDSRSASVDQLQDIDRQKERQKEELLRRHKEELRRQQQVSVSGYFLKKIRERFLSMRSPLG